MDLEARSRGFLLAGKAEPRRHERRDPAAADHHENAAPADQVGYGSCQRGAEEISGDHHCQIAAERNLPFRHGHQIADDRQRDRKDPARRNAGEHARDQ